MFLDLHWICSIYNLDGYPPEEVSQLVNIIEAALSEGDAGSKGFNPVLLYFLVVHRLLEALCDHTWLKSILQPLVRVVTPRPAREEGFKPSHVNDEACIVQVLE